MTPLPLPFEPDDQIFMHQDRHAHRRCFHVPSLIEATHRHSDLCRPARLPVDDAVLIHALSHGVVSPHRLGRIPLAHLEQPALICEVGREITLADGCHRLCRAVQLGRGSVPALFVPQRVWRHSLYSPERVAGMLGMPLTLLADPDTGFLELRRRYREAVRRYRHATGRYDLTGEPLRRAITVTVLTLDGHRRDLRVPPYHLFDAGY